MKALAKFITVCTLLFAGVSHAQGAHPALAACGGFTANHAEGIQNIQYLTREQEDTIEDFLRRADVAPGVAVAIVKGDKIVYARGFGYSNLANCQKTRSDTRFYLKSTTKNFLGAAAAVLQEEGAIELDAPISDYLPDLKFPDGLRTDQASLRSHLTHTNPTFDGGLNYRTAFPGNLLEKDYVDHLNKFSQVKNIRFRYSNVGPIIAAHAIGKKTGSNWRDFIRQKVFDPAGMTNSFTVMSTAEKGPMTTSYVGGETNAFQAVRTKNDSQMHAAGGAVSTAVDMGRWLVINLNHGQIDGRQALPRHAMEQMQARQVQLDKKYYEFTRFAYGLGLYSGTYDGDLLLHHFGGETHMSFMPEHDLGVVVLANEVSFGSKVTHALAATIYDMLLGKPEVKVEMDRRLAEITSAKANRVARRTQHLARLQENVPAHAPTFSTAALAGEYINPRLGKMSVSGKSGELAVRFGAMSGPLTPLGGDAYLAEFSLWGGSPEVFVFRKNEQKKMVLDWGGRIFTCLK